MFAGASRARQQALGRYGEKVGMAFQVVDDLLDYLGDQETTGKKVGNDFIEGKITLPLIAALARADEEQNATLRELLGGDRTRPESCDRLRDLLEQLGGFSYARKRAERLVDEAVAALDIFRNGNDPDSYEQLVAIAGYILVRKK
jgi:octaprenyl-diphosphate synthase